MSSDKPRLSQPVFLVGAERSGTTLLRLMLDHHPRLSFLSEMEYIVDKLPADGGWPDLRAFHQFLAIDRIFQGTGFTVDKNLSYPELASSFLLQKRDADAKPIVGATVHRHFDRLLRIWPDARFIHLIRDPRDVARSCIDMGWAGNVWTGVERWIEAEHLWKRMAHDLPAGRRIDVTYESLILDAQPTLTALCRFMGVEYDPAMMDYPQHSTYGLPDPKLIRQWKRKLTEQDIRLVESRVADMLTERGYELSGLQKLDVTPAMARKLRRQDRSYRLRLRLQRYGPWWFSADLLTRRLHLGTLHQIVKRRLNAIDSAFVR